MFIPIRSHVLAFLFIYMRTTLLLTDMTIKKINLHSTGGIEHQNPEKGSFIM